MKNADFRKIYKTAGAAITAVTLISTVLSSWVLVKFIRYLNSTQKSMKKLEKAADVYLTEHAEKIH